MKNILTLYFLVIGFVLTTQAQKERKKDSEKLTTEQQAELSVKKMTLKLDLTSDQQRKIKPLIAEKIAERKAFKEKRKAMKKSGEKRKKLSTDQRFEKKNKALDNKIAFKNKMKNILNKEQYEKFKKMNAKKMRNSKKKISKKKRKHKKELKK